MITKNYKPEFIRKKFIDNFSEIYQLYSQDSSELSDLMLLGEISKILNLPLDVVSDVYYNIQDYINEWTSGADWSITLFLDIHLKAFDPNVKYDALTDK